MVSEKILSHFFQCPHVVISHFSASISAEKDMKTFHKNSNVLQQSTFFVLCIVYISKTRRSFGASYTVVNRMFIRVIFVRQTESVAHRSFKTKRSAKHSLCAPFCFVPEERLELSLVTQHDFESCASTIPPLRRFPHNIFFC